MKKLFWLMAFCLLSSASFAGKGKLLSTAGVTQLEGAAGGGLVPWAVLAGYDSRDEVSVSVFATRTDVDEYQLDVHGAAIGLYDRVELSVAEQKFHIDALDTDIRQQVLGVKVRLIGDVIYSTFPQISIGTQRKKLKDSAIANAVGAREVDSEYDFYIAATKVHLGAVAGYNLLWNTTLRRSRANQLGLLGFGGDRGNRAELLAEASIAVLLGRHIAVGAEYRQKPDNLGFAKEDDWYDIFVAWFPNKHVNVTAAWAELGSVAGQQAQNGVYLSVTGYLW